MTLHEKLIGLATIAARDPDDIRWRLLCLLRELDNGAFKANPGAWFDRMFSEPKKDQPINLPEAA
jgi:hypothetical protein